MVSVIVPMYNAEKYAKQCINSILNQTYHNIEIILINDGSTDSTAKICDEFAKSIERVHIFHKQNSGPNSCRKLGFEQSNGDYIYYVDADDYIADDAVEKLLNACIKNNAQVSACGYSKVGAGDAEYCIKSNSDIIEKADFTKALVLPAICLDDKDETVVPDFLWNHMYKANCITSDCFISDTICTREDAYFNLAILNNIERVALVKEPLYFYRTNAQSLTVAYRDKKFEKDLYYIRFIKDYISHSGIESGDRVQRMIAAAMLGCIDNFAKRGSFKHFKDGMKKMESDSEIVKVMMNYNNLKLNSHQNLSCKLWNSDRYRLLYLYRKAVIKKSLRG